MSVKLFEGLKMAVKKVTVTKRVIAKMKGANVRCGPIEPRDKPYSLKDWIADSVIEQGCGELVAEPKKPKDDG